MHAIPNLIVGDPDQARAKWFYRQFLTALLHAGQTERVVEVCRAIRRFAKQAGKPELGHWTFDDEDYAYGKLGDFRAQWRLLRERERTFCGKTLDLKKHRWKREEAFFLMYYYAPLLFLRSQYVLGLDLLEKGLRFCANFKSYDLLGHIYNDIKTPRHRHEVTLSHFYRILGRDLRDWRYWSKFIDGFHSKLFRLSGIPREDIRNDPSLLKPFSDWMCSELHRRTFTGVSSGEADLIDSVAAVKKRQDALAAKLSRFEATPPTEAQIDQALRRVFPELEMIDRPS
jgi:hypothetical protein